MHAQAADGLCLPYASTHLRDRCRTVWVPIVLGAPIVKTFCAMGVRTHSTCMSHAPKGKQIGLLTVAQPTWELCECPGDLIAQLIHDQKIKGE